MQSLTPHIPELMALESRHDLVRIPPQTDVSVTPRVKRLVDTAAFRRLSKISQLGLVQFVYPAAHHARFEHSLGTFLVALQYLQRLQHDERFARQIGPHQGEVLLVAALLHDIGHWPFCHPIEDMKLPNIPRHEQFATHYLCSDEIALALREDWNIEPEEVIAVLTKRSADAQSRILSSLLSGPIDIDKMDYLRRDSLHAGVPYGQNFDADRLIGSLCLNEAGDGLALTEKGRTAAEMMVFSRYVMFSEVYWHHAVRAATAMLQRAFYLSHEKLDLDQIFRLTEDRWIETVRQQTDSDSARQLLSDLFGEQRRLYKRAFQFSHYQDREIYDQLARRPFEWLVRCAGQFTDELSKQLGRGVPSHHLLIDAPPQQLEIEFRVDVYFPKESRFRSLGDVSPVVKTLAHQQFDDYVKRVRIFVHPDLLPLLGNAADQRQGLQEAIRKTDA